MKAQLVPVNDHGVKYDCLAFCCPGCALDDHSGLHMLAVNTTEHSPSWTWDGNLEAPTISPSILTTWLETFRCHSFLEAGVFRFLEDSTHALSGQSVPMPDLPDWFVEDQD